MKVQDLTGQQFGYLTVIKRDQDKKNRAYWICQCCCGKTISVSGTKLRQGQQSCGCIRSKKGFIVSPNQKYGRLTLLKISDKKASNGTTLWECQCDCGNIVLVRRDALISGKTKSCGCLRKEQNLKNIHQEAEDLSGMRFGKLIALEKDLEKSQQKQHTYWRCLCECGKTTIVRASHLKSYDTVSCGCSNSSSGEIIIEQILKDNNIIYQREYKFVDLKDKNQLRFDFAIFDNQQELVCLIEFDGIQHFQEINNNYFSDSLADRQRRDNIKNQYCLKHNIPLFRINYKQLKLLHSIYDIINIQNLYKGEK